MPRFIGKSTNKSAIANRLDANITTENKRNSWTEHDFYSQMISKFDSAKSGSYKKYCLDFTDSDMKDSELKRFHQVVICGNDVIYNKSKSIKGIVGGFKNDKNYLITAQLPPTFRYSIGGNWSTPLKSVLDYSQFNGLTSSFTSGQNSALFGLATMSVWESPNPLQIQLTLSCFDDIGSSTNQNTLEAIDIFSRWSLPYMVTEYGMYAGLPGPAVPPISIKYNKYNEEKVVNEKGEDTGKTKFVKNGTETSKLVIADKEQNRLSVMIGGMLFLDYCILKTVDVNYVNTKAQYLHDYHKATFTNADATDAGIRLLPIRCDITLTFETIMGLTQTNFRQMLALRENSNPADMATVGLNVIQDAVGDQIAGGASKTLENTIQFGTNLENKAKSEG